MYSSRSSAARVQSRVSCGSQLAVIDPLAHAVVVQRLGQTDHARGLADHVADTGEILDFAPHREGESGALIGGGGCQEGPEIAVNLSLDLLFDDLDRGQDLHLGEVVVAIVGQQRLVVLGDGVELEHHEVGVILAHGVQAVLHQRGCHGVVGIGEVYVRADSLSDTGVAGVGQAAVGLVNHAYARVAGGPGVAHGRAIVGEPSSTSRISRLR